MVIADLADMHETVHTLFQFDKGAKAGELADLALDELANLIAAGNARPGIFLRLLEAQANALVLRRDFEHDGFDFVGLLEHFARMVDFPGPAHIGHMDHAVHAFFQLDEGAVVGEVANLALDPTADGVLRRDIVPRVGFRLANAQGDFLFVLVHVQHNRVDHIAGVEDIRGPRHALGPGNFADMHETFDTLFQLHECAVRDQVHDLAADAGALRVLHFDLFPRILELLLQTERNALLLLVDIQHKHFEFLAHGDHFARVIDAAPAHIGDMQQAVHSAQIHERTEIGDVLDDTRPGLARLDFGEQFLLQTATRFFDQIAARQHDVAAFLIDLEHLALELLAEEIVQIPHRHHIDLGTRQEGIHAAHIHEQAALDLALDHPGDDLALFAGGGDVVPVALLFGAGLAQHDHAVLVFEAFEEDFYIVADMDVAQIFELGGRQKTFRLISDINQNFLGVDFDHLSRN